MGAQSGEGGGREGPEEVIEPEQRRQGPNVTQENGATLIDHGLTLREAGLVRPNLSTNTVVTVIQKFHPEKR